MLFVFVISGLGLAVGLVHYDSPLFPPLGPKENKSLVIVWISACDMTGIGEDLRCPQHCGRRRRRDSTGLVGVQRADAPCLADGLGHRGVAVA